MGPIAWCNLWMSGATAPSRAVGRSSRPLREEALGWGATGATVNAPLAE